MIELKISSVYYPLLHKKKPEGRTGLSDSSIGVSLERHRSLLPATEILL